MEAQQLTEPFSKKFSHRSTRSVDLLGSVDIFDIVLNLFLANNEDRYRQLETRIAESQNDIEVLIKFVNYVVGSPVLVLDEDTVSLSATELSKIFEKLTIGFIGKEFRDNLFLQLSLTKLLQEQVKKSVPTMKAFLEEKKLCLKDLQKLIAATTVMRTKRDVDVIGALISFVRTMLIPILSPIQTNINTFLDTINNIVLSFYIETDSTISVLKIISDFTNPLLSSISEFIVTVQNTINAFFNNILYGNSTTEVYARKRRDIYSSGNFELKNSRSILSDITTWINTFLKTIFNNFLSNMYVTIGQILTYPVRLIFEIVVNLLFSCTSDCISVL